MRLAVVCRFDRRDERRLARRAAPGPTWTFAAKIGVVHLNLALQAFRRIAFEHDLRELVLHLPGRVLRDPEPARKFEAGYPLFRLRDVIHGRKPQAERQFAGGERRSCPHGRLLAAGVALEQFAHPARHDAMRLAGAIGTFKTIRPAPFDKRRVALLLAAIRLVECAFAETFLKLHLVARHR